MKQPGKVDLGGGSGGFPSKLVSRTISMKGMREGLERQLSQCYRRRQRTGGKEKFLASLRSHMDKSEKWAETLSPPLSWGGGAERSTLSFPMLSYQGNFLDKNAKTQGDGSLC